MPRRIEVHSVVSPWAKRVPAHRVEISNTVEGSDLK